MAADFRVWSLAGPDKVSSATVATLTASTVGTNYPQVGDLICVGWAGDVLAASTPTLTSIAVTGAGAIGALTKASSADNGAVAGTGLAVGYAYATVTTAFTSATVLTLTLSGAITAKAVGVVAVINAGTATIAQAPTHANTIVATAPANGAAVQMQVAESATAPGGANGLTTPRPTAATIGGAAATNAALTIYANTNGGQAGISGASGGTFSITWAGTGGAVALLPDLIMAPRN